MKYYINKTVEMTFEEAETKVREELQKEGFGVLTEIDVKEKFKEKVKELAPPKSEEIEEQEYRFPMLF